MNDHCVNYDIFSQLDPGGPHHNPDPWFPDPTTQMQEFFKDFLFTIAIPIDWK